MCISEGRPAALLTSNKSILIKYLELFLLTIQTLQDQLLNCRYLGKATVKRTWNVLVFDPRGILECPSIVNSETKKMHTST